MSVSSFCVEPAVFVSNAEWGASGFVGHLEEIERKQFFKLVKTYNISKLLCAWCGEHTNQQHVKNLMSKTDVIEQICEARDNLFVQEMEKIGVKITPQTRLWSKAQKTKLLQVPEIDRVVARGHAGKYQIWKRS